MPAEHHLLTPDADIAFWDAGEATRYCSSTPPSAPTGSHRSPGCCPASASYAPTAPGTAGAGT